MRFYGLSPNEVWEMSAEDERMLWEAITVIEAQETLVQLQVASFPNLKKPDQEKLHRGLHKMAYPENYEKPMVLTAEQLAKVLHG